MKHKLAVLSILIVALCLISVGDSWAVRGYIGNFIHKGASGQDVTGYGAKGDGSTNDSAAFSAAIAAATFNRVIVPAAATSYKLSTNVTVPAGVTIVFQQGGLLSIDGGVILTINGKLEAEAHRIFSGTGTVSFAVGSCDAVYPEWWGAVGDNSTDCTAAFNAALVAAESVGMVRVLTGTYIISSPINQWPADTFSLMQSGIVIQGNGTYSELKYTGTTGYCLDVTAADELDAGNPVGSVIQDIHMSAPNIADPDDGGCIALTAANNMVNRVSIDDANGATGIAIKPRDVNQSEASMTNDTNRDLTTTGAGASEKYAFKFTSQSRASELARVILRLGKTGAPAGTSHLELWSDDGGSPSKPNAQVGDDSNTVTNTALSAAADGADQVFDWYHKAKPTVSASTAYWIVLSTTGYTYTDTTTEVRLRVDAGDGGADEFGTFTWGGAWATSNDGVNHAITITFGQPLDIFVSQCHFYGSTKIGRGIWLDSGDSVLTINDCFIAGKEGIRSYDGWILGNGLYLFSTDASYSLLYLDESWVALSNCWLEAAGTLFFGGDHGNWYTITNSIVYAAATWESGVRFTQTGCTGDTLVTDDASVIPDTFRYKIMPMVSGLWHTTGGTIASDADTLNGDAMELDTRYELTGIELRWDYGAAYLTVLPRGAYKVTIWMKDSNQLANDCRFYSAYWDGAWQADWDTTLTLTADYRPYTFMMVIDSHEKNALTTTGKRFRIYRDALGANTISISHAVMEYMGPDIPAEGDLVAYNTDASDADEARPSSVLFYGRQSGNESIPMAEIEATHNGASDDTQGQVRIKVNDGNDPIGGLNTEVTIDEDGVTIADDLTIGGSIIGGLTVSDVWTLRTSAAANEWRSVTYGNGLFVAVSITGTGNRVMTSPDGINWTSRTSAADESWYSVTYGNGMFVAVAITGNFNSVMTSPDGINWTSRANSVNNAWIAVTYGNGLFVAVSITGTGDRVMTSPDGITWTTRVSAADNDWRAITYGDGLFVAVANTGTGDRVMTSPDGITWTSRVNSVNNQFYGVTYANGLFVAVSNDGTGDRVMTSPDGITWTTRVSAADNFWYGIDYGDGLFVAVAQTGTGNRIMTSPDGITWTVATSPANNDWFDVAFGNGIFTAVAFDGISNSVMTSGKMNSNAIPAMPLHQITLDFRPTAYGDGADNAGTVTFPHDNTNHRNFWRWSSGIANQDMDLVWAFRLPPNFSAWTTESAFFVDVRSNSYAGHTLTASLYDGSGSVDAGINAASIIPTSDNTWETKNDLPTASYTAGDWLHLHIHCDIDTADDTIDLARIYFTYLASN